VPHTNEPAVLEHGGANAIGRMLGLLGDEWNLLIIQQALMGASRYSHFMSRLPISNSVLTSRLRVLVNDGLLARRLHRSTRARTEYLTTPRSRSLWPVLLSVWEWERTWVPRHAEQLPEMRHEECGEHFSPLLRCSGCQNPAHPGDVQLTLGPSGQWGRSAPAAATRRRPDSESAVRQAGLFGETMSVLGNRWAAALLLATFLGTTRFTDFQAQLGAPPSLLAERLQTFCGIGVLVSMAPADRGADDRGAYLLTEKGRAFLPVMVAALQWAQRWFRAPDGPAMVLTHRGCGEAFTGELACGSCAGRLTGAQVAISPAATAGIP
jgi:DNA-binding HxlR family transcriptional regulator